MQITNELIIESRIRNFKVIFVNDFKFIDYLLHIPNSKVVVGSVVYNLYKKVIFNKFERENVFVVELDEDRKTLETVSYLYQKLLQFPAKKNLTIISFGGGTNQDVTGFLASTLYRGINWVYVPTTLLAQADSAVGLKTSLNFQSYKNVVGTFYPPSLIYLNPSFLKTLSKKDFYSGMGEVIKLLLMRENAVSHLPNICDRIKELAINKDCRLTLKTIKECIEIKLAYMKGDEFDLGRRNLLNYGHELGHSLESTSNFNIPHGAAVIIGMIFANSVSFKRGWLDKATYEFIEKKVLLPYIPIDITKLRKEYFQKERLLKNFKQDKKRVGEKLVLVLPKKNFELIKIIDYDTVEFERNLADLLLILKPYF